MKRNMFFFLVQLIWMCPLSLAAQQSTVAGGGNASGVTGSASFTVGQAVYAYYSSADGNVSEGVQQVFDVMMVSTSDIGDAFSLQIFPNPASNSLHMVLDPLVVGNFDQQKLSYTLSNAQGLRLKHDNIHASEILISLEDLPEALYFLNLQYQHETIKTFKIVKTNE